MKHFHRIALTAMFCGGMAANGWGAAVVLGLTNKHPLSETQTGELLLAELRCAACHARNHPPPLSERTAPDLSDVGARVAPEFLQRFIASPSTAHRGTTMPDLLSAEPAAERERIAAAISRFLIDQSPHRFHRDPANSQDIAAGKEWFHTVGCIACHSPRDDNGRETTREGVVDLEQVAAKYSLKSLADFLFQPLRVRASGRMPDMKLTRAEARSIAGYLLGASLASPAPASAPASAPAARLDGLAADGKKYFRQFNCAACHKLGDIPAAPRHGDLTDSNSARGCLAKTSSNSPRYHLSDEQTKAIRAALGAKVHAFSDKATVALTLTAFNCIACHARGDYGGVSTVRNTWFQTTEKNLGDDARIPPALTLVGAKLKTAWMMKVLFDAESARPYMLTRMPQFGEPNLRGLPERLDRIDTIEKVDLPIPDSENGSDADRRRATELRRAGHELLGDKALYCVACHNFNGKPSPNYHGIDLTTTYERLKPSWFYHFLINPAAYRPRIIMPLGWPGGKAVQKTILGGNAHDQIDAIWYFLSLGTSAQDPSGIRRIETKLSVGGATRTYRGRSGVAGYRGIAVGFPDRVSYAFNAETGTLTAIWRGDFIHVDRSGQGSGAFQPASRFVQLAQDVSFCKLADEQSPWPLRPTMTKEHPVNPDPLYPKNHGYQFKGYSMDDASIPTFMYRSGTIEIEDRSNADTTGKKPRLKRVFTFSSPREQTVWFRALAGKIEAKTNRQYEVRDLRLSIPPLHALLRPLAGNPGGSELLIRFEIPQGKSTVSLTYELLQ